MNLKKIFIISYLSIIPLQLHAEEVVNEQQTFWSKPTFSGDWFGLRQKMSDKGAQLDIVYTADVMADVSGGVDKAAEYLDNLDLTLSLDMEKLVGWKGGSFFIYGISNWGGNPTNDTGDAQGVDNIEAQNSARLHEAWVQQNFLDDKLSFKLGLYDTNSEFDVIETGGLFINSSPGMGPDFSQSGLNGAGAFPATGLATRILAKPFKGFYIQSAVAEGTPQDPVHPNSPLQIQYDSGEGVLLLNEVGYLTQDKNEEARYGKFSLGGWYYTAQFDDLVDLDGSGNPVQRANFGIYGFGEYNVYAEKDNADQGLNIYLRAGYANASVNQFQEYIGVGAVYTGLIPKRDEDQIGLNISTAINGGKYKQAATASGDSPTSAEINLELTYRAQILPWLAIQPDIQYVFNPGTTNLLNDAFVVGSRFELIF